MEKICENCDNVFDAENNKRRFCSNKCCQEKRSKENRKIIHCLFCDKEFYDIKSSKRKYCSQECQHKQISKMGTVITQCSFCGKEYSVKKFRHEEFLRGEKECECCSNECANKMISFNNRGKNSPVYTERVSKICLFCKKEYFILRSKRGSKYCSRECKDRHRVENAKVSLVCECCGKEFMKKRGEVDFWGTIKYCSPNCRFLSRRERTICKCLICEKEYELPNSYAKKNKTCSRECQSIWNSYNSKNDEKLNNILKNNGVKSMLKSRKEGTLPERMVQEYLERENVLFVPQYVLNGILAIDFYLPHYNCALEVYGDYWHANPRKYGEDKIPLNEMQLQNKKKDFRRMMVIKKKYSMNFYSIWEYDINKDIEKTMNDFFNYINNKIRNESVNKQ